MLRARRDADAWAANDLPLLDEAESLLRGGTRQFEHVVVDEAQDLSPMQLRMLARRARHRSMTVLGDLAQATGPASPGTWEETLAHLGAPANAETAELTMGYRLPGAVLSLANRLLARPLPASLRRGRCAPTVTTPTSIWSRPTSSSIRSRTTRSTS